MENNTIQQWYSEYGQLLFSLAYKMTGSASDAEDIIQDVFTQLKSYELQHQQHIKAFLCKLVTNRCLDLLKSAAKKREVYVGTWLPEPIVKEYSPLDEVIREEEVSIALLRLFDQLTPVERAVFILHDVLDYDYASIAHIVEKTESNCRKILSRIKQKLPTLQTTMQAEISGNESKKEHEEVVLSFMAAFQEGNVKELVNHLREDIVYYADGGGKKTAAMKPIIGKERVMALLDFISHIVVQPNFIVSLCSVNGQTGFKLRDLDGTPSIISFDVEDKKIKTMYYMVNPDKLAHMVHG
ncbi:RNA polymerase sigma factor SigJ [Longirhabdus pacifica]|uniref:RNA polymerase sigma factor SigJ n=1 Tax=Longirhabdus pacifica TaxID=2305227 RepID=UPI001008FBA1|nr:RNA polymerase sigma factor SigJ [Longirhabdus pacifica]